MKKKRKGKNKGSGGRKPNSGVLSGIFKSEEWSDIRSRVIYGSAEWRIVRLRELIGDGSRSADNNLSSRRADLNARAGREEIDVLWDEWSAECERAVLDGDADWFARQAKAITKGGLPQRAQFNAKVVELLELAFWRTWAKQRAQQERKGRHMHSPTLTPAGKRTDLMASDIWHALEKRELPDGRLLVESWNVESKERVMEAIHDLAKSLRFKPRKQH